MLCAAQGDESSPCTLPGPSARPPRALHLPPWPFCSSPLSLPPPAPCPFPQCRRIRVALALCLCCPPRRAELGGCKSNARLGGDFLSGSCPVVLLPPLSFLLHPKCISDKRVKSSPGPLLGERAVAVLYLDPVRIYINSLHLFGSIYSTAGSGKGSPQGFISYKQTSQTAEKINLAHEIS